MADLELYENPSGILNIETMNSIKISCRLDNSGYRGRKYKIELLNGDESKSLTLKDNVSGDELRPVFGNGTVLYDINITEFRNNVNNMKTLISFCSANASGKLAVLKFTGTLVTQTVAQLRTHPLTVTYRLPVYLRCESMKPGTADLSISAAIKALTGYSNAGAYSREKQYADITCSIKSIANMSASHKYKVGNTYYRYYEVSKIVFSGITFNNKSTSVTVTNPTDSTNVTTANFNTPGEYTITAKVQTKDGWSTNVSTQITVNNYIPPTLNVITEPFRTLTSTASEEDIVKGKDYNIVGQIKVNASIGTFIRNECSCEIQVNRRNEAPFIFDISKGVSNLAFSSDNKSYTLNLIASPNEFEDGDTPAGNLYKSDGTRYGLRITDYITIKFTVTDNAGGKNTLEYKVATTSTTLHLKAGGDGVKFGGYATKSNLVDSAWSIHSDANIEADGSLHGKGLIIDETLEFNGTTATGIGAGINRIAAGDHSHGIIPYNGNLSDETKRNTVLFVDGNGDIKAAKLNTSVCTDGKVNDIAILNATNNPSVGSANAAVAKINHIHKIKSTANAESVQNVSYDALKDVSDAQSILVDAAYLAGMYEHVKDLLGDSFI